MKPVQNVMTYSPRWDLFGTCGSSLCVAHCILTPILIAMLPLAGLEILESEAIHKGLVLGVAGIGILAFGPGYMVHRRGQVLGLMALGLALLGFAAFGVEALLPESVHEWAETGLTMAGGFTMVSAHWFNRTFCKNCSECDDTEDC